MENSSSPFGCVLRDSNSNSTRRSSRENNNNDNARAAAFQKNLKELVRGEFHNRISISADENSHSQNLRDEKLHYWLPIPREQPNKKHHHRNLRFLTNHHSRHNENKRSFDDSDITTSSRQSRILNRWAARQAREMESTIEKQSQEAERLASSSSSSSSSGKESSVPSVGNLGASSLVQIWEARLNRSNSLNRYPNSESSTSRTTSTATEESSMDDSVNHEESCAEWESQSDRTAQSEQSQARNLDSGEKERVRVADIIKKLTSGNDDNENEMITNANESSSRERRNSPRTDQPRPQAEQQLQQRGFSLLVNSPKLIRGRQAFAALLMKLQSDRHRELDSLVERQAVSRFSHRGRIQAMLRLRFLQRGLAIQAEQRPQSPGSPVNRLPQGSAIMHLREKFSTGFEQGGTAQAQSDATATRSSPTEMGNKRVNMDNRRLSEDSHQHQQEAHNVGRQSTATVEHSSAPQTSKDNNNNRESCSSTNVETAHHDSKVTAEALKGGDTSGIAEDQQQHKHTHLNTQGNSERITSVQQGEANEQQQQHPHLDSQSQESAETTTVSLNEVEETYELGHFVENNYDWISEISRPRSYWEDRRQAWYQEMLSTTSENEEIRQLLERRRVSSSLASEFRETMDQLMTSRLEIRQIDLEGYEDEEEDASSRERIGQLLLSHLQRNLQPAVSQEEQQQQAEEEDQDRIEQVVDEEEEEDYTEEEPSPTSRDHHHETSDYSDQSTPSPTPMRSWGFRDHEVGDDHVSSPRPVLYQDSPMSSSSTSRLSIEMELIYDLRGQMAQLHREMTELRKSIQSCMDMQVTLQHPHPDPHEVHSVGGTGNNSLDVATKKRKCCICYEMNVDSLLYRCGHMCTCLKCAHELQWSSGKCPICRAPIADVVKAYIDS